MDPSLGRPRSTAIGADPGTPLGRLIAPAQADGSGAGDRFHLLASGVEAFQARMDLIESAQASIDIQYYLVHDGMTTDLVMEALLRAADRGVRVRLLVDDMNTLGHDFWIAALAAHPRIEVRLFNPFVLREPSGASRVLEAIFSWSRINRRMHNKLFLADGAAAILGGRNLGDEYYDAQEEENFADLDLFLLGPMARDLAASFDAFWNSRASVPAEAASLIEPGPSSLQRLRQRLAKRIVLHRSHPYVQRMRRPEADSDLLSRFRPWHAAAAKLVQEPPAKAGEGPEVGFRRLSLPLNPEVLSFCRQARQELIIVSPYLVPGREGVEFLAQLVRAGVRVRVLTNSLASTDVLPVHPAYARYRIRLLEAGVDLYEMRPGKGKLARKHDPVLGGRHRGSLHAKAFVQDAEAILVGTMNFDPRSADLNTEAGVIVHSRDMAQELRRHFDQVVRSADVWRLKLDEQGSVLWLGRDQEGGPEKTYRDEPGASPWRKARAYLTGLALSESML